MDNWVVCVNSLDKVAGSASNYDYTVYMPAIPEGNYKATVSFINGSLTATVGYGLQFKSPQMVRTVNTQIPSDGFSTVCVMNGTQAAIPGVCYFSGAPQILSVRLITLSTGAVVNTSVVNTALLMHLERLDPEVKCECKGIKRA